MATPRKVHYGYEQYLAMERDSPVRHEYLDGEIYAMAGGTPEHAALAAAVMVQLGPGLPRGCRFYTSDLRVRIPASGLTTYPDAAVVCGPVQRAVDDSAAATNPVLLVEITSDSTEDYDRGAKLRHYQQLPSVREVLIVSHRGPTVTVHRRGDAGWTELRAGAGESIELASLGARLDVDQLYREASEGER